MARHLACLVGMHKWARKITEDGGRYRECARCRKVDEGGAAPPGWGVAAGG